MCVVAKSYPALCDPRHCSKPVSLSFTSSRSLLKFVSMFIELVMPSNHLTIQWLGDLNDFIYEKRFEISNLNVSALTVMVVVSGVTR